MAFLTLFVALAISAVAAYYSIVGLVAIFAASAVPIIIMGSVLEVGKLITASWLYRNWKQAPFLLKTYFTTAVLVLMLITSMGIYGFLSKAHIDQGVDAGDATAKIELLEQKIAQEQTTIQRYEQQLAQLDQALDKYVELGAVTKGLNARKEQEAERTSIREGVDAAYEMIDGYNVTISELKGEIRAFEVEIGPIKYIAELAGSTDFEAAVRYVILSLIFVFDPLAVLLVIAANMELVKREKKKQPEAPKTVSMKEHPKAYVKTSFEEVEVETNPITDEIEFKTMEKKK